MEHQLFTRIFAFKLFHNSIFVAYNISSKYYIYNSLLTILPQADKIWTKSDDPIILSTQKLDLFDKNLYIYVNQFLKYIVSAILKEVLHVKQILMLRVFIIRLPSSFTIPRITVVSLSLETKFKIELNMGDLPCLFRDSSNP